MKSEAAALEETEHSIYVPESDADDDENQLEAGPDALKALNSFLVASGKEPSPCHLQVPWESARKKTQFFYVSKVKEVITETVRTLAPYDKRNLLQATLNSLEAGEINDETLSVSSDILMAVVESYNTLSEPRERRQLLSIIADIIPFKRLQELISGISRHQVTQAKKHKDQFGRGAAVPVSAGLPRERVDSARVDHFLDFVTSSHITQDLPFGTKNIKLDSGEVIEIPNIIRLMIPSRVVEQYFDFCKGREFEPLGKRTLLRILSNSCPASERKSLQGLDYYVADGGKAFDNLLSVIEELELYGLSKEESSEIKQALREGKTYLKSEYKVIIIQLKLPRVRKE